MKIQIVSDLHIEFDPLFELPQTDADVIVLAGDIGVGYEQEVRYCTELSQKHGKQVLFVLGNHTFYDGDFDLIREKWYDTYIDGVTLLDEGRMFVKDDVTFMGGTLWTNFMERDQESMNVANKNMNDFLICTMQKEDSMGVAKTRDSYLSKKRGLTEESGVFTFNAQRSADEHDKTIDWMNVVLNDFKSKKNVVVSHHAPSYQSVHPRYAGDMLNAAFTSNLEDWIGTKPIDLWVHGHMHDVVDYMVYDTRVVCNPKGYPREYKMSFNPSLVIEV